DRSPRPLLAEPTGDFALLIDQVAQLAPTQEHGQLSAALHTLRVVHDRLAAPAPPLHVHVFTDAQQSQMLSRSAAALPGAERWQWHTHIADADNLALARARTWPSEPIAQQPATVTAELTNHSDRPRTAAVSLRVASQPLATRRVFLDSFEQAVVSFDVTFH